MDIHPPLCWMAAVNDPWGLVFDRKQIDLFHLSKDKMIFVLKYWCLTFTFNVAWIHAIFLLTFHCENINLEQEFADILFHVQTWWPVPVRRLVLNKVPSCHRAFVGHHRTTQEQETKNMQLSWTHSCLTFPKQSNQCKFTSIVFIVLSCGEKNPAIPIPTLIEISCCSDSQITCLNSPNLVVSAWIN